MFNLKKDKTKVEIELSIDNKEWEEGVQKVYEQNKGKYAVVGFRKGHAPRRVIEQQYGDSIFFEDTVDYFVNKTMNDVLEKNPELEPVAMPTTQFESYTKDAGLKMKILFEIIPDFELCKYKDVTIKVHSAEVTDGEVEHQIHHLLEDNATFTSVDREIKNGDSVMIDFIGFIDNVEFEGGSATNYPLEIGSHSFIDTFEDQLVGHKKGEVVDVNVTFPENYHAEEFKGKPATFKVTINDIREKTLPTLDDNFISNATEFETVEEYKKDVTAHIQTMKQNELEAEFEYNMREYLVANTEIEIPEVMIETMQHHEMHRLQDALEAYHIPMEQYLLSCGISSVEEYMKSLRERTIMSIKSRYIYRKIIEENKLEVPAAELEAATAGMTEREDKIRTENEMILKIMNKFLRDNNKIEITDEE
ncbi:MAG: trigger factor [Clostridia bacterium]|nr:trigger factor [Clostridia bacterium]